LFTLRIRLPQDRRFCGVLNCHAPTGEVVLGPIPVAGKAGEQLARSNYNPTRTPLLPYGDTPAGSYRFSRLLSMRSGTELDVARYGRFGIVVFDPCTGDAALAEAAGRFELWLHGGSLTEGRLSSTAGSLRLFDDDQRQLMRVLGASAGAACVISIDPAIAGDYGAVSDETRSDYFDPPTLHHLNSASQCALLSSLTYAQNPGLLYLGEYDSGQYFSSIDVNHVITNEGGVLDSVYVPRAGDGYTVGGGINVSAQSVQSLQNMGVDQATITALSSVIGVYPPNGSTTAPGITLTDAQAQAMTTAVMNSYFNSTGQSYSNACSFADFTDLPTQAQTAIADLAYKMGSLATAAPNLWTQVTSGNWQAAVNNLMGINGQPPFSSSDATLNSRASADGKLIQQALTAGTLPTP
jgi:GH24 family phage-related lysozyme (muramidase)